MAGVVDGQAVSAGVTNDAFLAKNGDDTAQGKITLANTDPESGAPVANIQKVINEQAVAITAAQGEIDAHAANMNNPHGVTAEQVGAVDPSTLTAHTGDTTNPHGIRRYSANVAMDGTQTTKDVDVSASIADARLAIWQLLDLSTNSFATLLVEIRRPSATTVRIVSDPPLMSGNYRLIGVQL